MTTSRARDWAWKAYDYPTGVPTCVSCGSPLDECACVCPFCGSRDGCRCCIGIGIATGGD